MDMQMASQKSSILRSTYTAAALDLVLQVILIVATAIHVWISLAQAVEAMIVDAPIFRGNAFAIFGVIDAVFDGIARCLRGDCVDRLPLDPGIKTIALPVICSAGKDGSVHQPEAEQSRKGRTGPHASPEKVNELLEWPSARAPDGWNTCISGQRKRVGSRRAKVSRLCEWTTSERSISVAVRCLRRVIMDAFQDVEGAATTALFYSRELTHDAYRSHQHLNFELTERRLASILIKVHLADGLSSIA